MCSPDGLSRETTTRFSALAKPRMQITKLLKIVTAKRQGLRSYLVVFVADTGTFELFLPGANSLDGTVRFLSPSLRSQATGQSWVVGWPLAELLATHLETVIDAAYTEASITREVIEALTTGERQGVEV